MFVRRIVFAALLILFVLPAFAVSMSERSLLAQGTWWNPSRAGSGLDIFHAGDQIVVVWYTFDADGLPVWYYSQGSLSSLGKQSWDLQKHRWSGGRKAGYTVAGSLRLDVRNPESADLSWTIGGNSGKWTIEPFRPSGIQSEVDHTGMWFDPANPGWGLSFTEQGDVVGGALLFYDARGEPTWVAGYERAKGSVSVHQYSGSCPQCTYTGFTARPAGRLAFDFGSETDMVVSLSADVAMASGVNVSGSRVAQMGRPSSTRASDRQLANFSTATELKAFLDKAMNNIPSYAPAPGGFSAPGPSTNVAPFSLTNLQEAGVDEADLVKSDGEYMYTFAHSGSTPQPAVRIARRAGTESMQITSVPITAGVSSHRRANPGLLLSGNRLAALASTYSYYATTWWAPITFAESRTYIDILDATTRSAPSALWKAEVDGGLVATRRIGDTMYVVTRFVPYLPGFIVSPSSPQYLSNNERILAATPLASLLPKVRINGGDAMPVVEPSTVYVPPMGGRSAAADMVVVLAIDLREPRVADAMVIVGSAETVYASPSSIYVASSRYTSRSYSGSLQSSSYFFTTDIHQIKLDERRLRIVGSASVEGFLGAQSAEQVPFRMSEHGGRLRVVTSSGAMWGPAANRLTVLEPSLIAPGVLKTVGYIPNRMRPESLGKPNEFLHATRFSGNRLYAVTFKKIDPLYVVDISDPADPRIAGELELPGFSDYLHPISDSVLLGFGKDTRPSGVSSGDGNFAWYQGLQFTLFDVSSPAQPREIDRLLIGKRGSDSNLLRDHHAFTILPRGDVLSIAFPARVNDGTVPAGSADWTFYPWFESGMMRVDVSGTNPASARLFRKASLITHGVGKSVAANVYDASTDSARSVMFADGSAVYVGYGLFWVQDATGTVSGPH